MKLVVSMVLVAALVAAGSAQAAPSWTVVPSPAVSDYGELVGVAAVSADDVWAVGYAPPGTPLVEHWDGTAWSVIPYTVPGKGVVLTAVSATSSGQVWISGYRTVRRSSLPLLARWRRGKFRAVAAPPDAELLYGVAVVSGKDVWVTGQSVPAYAGGGPMVAQWDGASWAEVTDGASGGFDHQIAATKQGDWTTQALDGGTLASVSRFTNSTLYSSDFPETGGSFLGGVSAVGNSAWAVGSKQSDTSPLPLAVHSTGHTYKQIDPASSIPSELQGVVEISESDVWAIGEQEPSTIWEPLAEQWNGSSWTPVSLPAVAGEAELASIAAVPGNPNDLWAVGYQVTGTGIQPLIMLYSG